jgi:hypothetical protein
MIYMRQLTQSQVMTNLESQRRQYDLVEMARGQWSRRSYALTQIESNISFLAPSRVR